MCLPQATEREICSDSKYESKWQDPDCLMFLNVGSSKSIKMLLQIWLVLKHQGTVYPKWLPFLEIRAECKETLPCQDIEDQNSVLTGLFFLEIMISWNLLINFFSYKKYDIFCMMVIGVEGIRSSSCVSQNYIKTKGFWICGNLYAAVLAIACLIVNSDGMT